MSKPKSDEYLTPPEIIEALGQFDLDPCSPYERPWDTARVHYNAVQDGLAREWFGRVWLNPPYVRGMGLWLKKMVKHRNGIAFIFVRTETRLFHTYVWGVADAILFLKGRTRFYLANEDLLLDAPAASCLVAYGKENAKALRESGIEGHYVNL